MTSKSSNNWGILAQYEDPAALTHACEKVRDAGYSKWDAYCPFPVHDLNEAMGLPRSKVGWIVITGACTGLLIAVLLQWWTSAVDYPITVAGKPFWAWEQFTPIMFELAVLVSAFGAIFGMLALNGLPRLSHPLFDSERFLRASDDAFFIAIESKDARYSETATRSLLESAGATSIELIQEDQA
ncbi:MAG: DUF3341 domain-containing protein [Phycisphaeraceae bacterium]|nr:DUF3341 domain-containing protein [Phycisphaeraceae bacterium]MCB9847446.1 DUF3341 domain-containing protein [Phycisphaeraceae bacterium]